MRKQDEIADPRSCLNRAAPTEWVFTLLGRDAAAADTVRFWLQKRIALGKNDPDDAQIAEAKAWIAAVVAEHGHPYQSRSVGALEEAMRDERERIASWMEQQADFNHERDPAGAAKLRSIAALIRDVPDFTEPCTPLVPSRPDITAPLAGKTMAEAKDTP